MFTGVHIETLRQPQQHRFRKTEDVERLKPIHGNLDKRATEALKYLVEVRSITIDVLKISFDLGSSKQCNSSSSSSSSEFRFEN
jgi:hypothetical protein